MRLKLVPSPEQAALLRDTLRRANDAANAISVVAWRERTFRQFKLHKLVYAQTRTTTGLSAQIVVRLIAKVADAYKVGCAQQRRFRREETGAQGGDEACLRAAPDGIIREEQRVSLNFIRSLDDFSGSE